MTVLPNFVRDGEFAPSSSAGSGSHALFASRLVEEKGADTAIAACSSAGVRLVLAGDGPDLTRLRALAANSGGEVEFAGHVDAGELVRLRSEAAVALAPSRWDEPCPYTVIESLAAGLPVLAARVGGLPEMVGGDATLPARDIPAWSKALGDLWRDRVRLGQLGESALARARELFSADRFYAGLMKLYGGER
jgi:glycosyltransferase involved in cell wall biosynthesis